MALQPPLLLAIGAFVDRIFPKSIDEGKRAAYLPIRAAVLISSSDASRT